MINRESIVNSLVNIIGTFIHINKVENVDDPVVRAYILNSLVAPPSKDSQLKEFHQINLLLNIYSQFLSDAEKEQIWKTAVNNSLLIYMYQLSEPIFFLGTKVENSEERILEEIKKDIEDEEQGLPPKSLGDSNLDKFLIDLFNNPKRNEE